MASRRDFGPTDIARQNADVFITVARWLVRLLLPIAIVCFAVATVIGLQHHVVVTPSLFLHHLGAGDANASLWRLAVIISVTLVGVTLESLVLCRDAFAGGELRVLTALLATARRFFLGACRTVLLVPSSPLLRAARSADDDPDGGILFQLRSALAIAPIGPPALLPLGSDPWGPFGKSGQRAEVCAAA